MKETIINILPFLKVRYGVVEWKGEEYREGQGVYLVPGTFNFKFSNTSTAKKKRKGDQVRVHGKCS